MKVLESTDSVFDISTRCGADTAPGDAIQDREEICYRLLLGPSRSLQELRKLKVRSA